MLILLMTAAQLVFSEVISGNPQHPVDMVHSRPRGRFQRRHVFICNEEDWAMDKIVYRLPASAGPSQPKENFRGRRRFWHRTAGKLLAARAMGFAKCGLRRNIVMRSEPRGREHRSEAFEKGRPVHRVLTSARIPTLNDTLRGDRRAHRA